jgi:hypothetical protein
MRKVCTTANQEFLRGVELEAAAYRERRMQILLHVRKPLLDCRLSCVPQVDHRLIEHHYNVHAQD